MSIETIKKAICEIPSSEFLAQQALTVKIELTLRDRIHFNLIKNNEFARKEVKGFSKDKSAHSSCDLALFTNGTCLGKDLKQLIELKQYYTDDVVCSNKAPKKIIDFCVKDLEKYPESFRAISILFLSHFECAEEDFHKHGNQFTYYEGFRPVRKRLNYDHQRILIDCEAQIRNSISNNFPKLELKDCFKIKLGDFANITVWSQVFIIQMK